MRIAANLEARRAARRRDYGWEVLGRLRRSRPTQRIPVVAISADASRGTIDRLLVANMCAYLTKPLNVDHFLHLLNSMRFSLTPSAETAGTA